MSSMMGSKLDDVISSGSEHVSSGHDTPSGFSLNRIPIESPSDKLRFRPGPIA
jgi:hypothetical protein